MDYSKVTDQIFVGSNLCRDEDCPEHSEEFKKLGIEVEINLDNQKREHPPDALDSYTWLPVVDGYALSLPRSPIGSSIIHEAAEDGYTFIVEMDTVGD